jgi:protein-disulfide isomerase
MPIPRRVLLSRSLLALTAAVLPLATARAADPRMSERSIGRADAPSTVLEYFSLTCTHCAAFARQTLPEVKARLVDTGKVRLVFRDFPLDQVALTAAMVARALPPERYDPFIEALFASQDRWAFGKTQEQTRAELQQLAALAGMPRATFEATIADTGLRDAILAEQQQGETQYHIDSTPTFIIAGQAHPGEMSYDEFSKLVLGS